MFTNKVCGNTNYIIHIKLIKYELILIAKFENSSACLCSTPTDNILRHIECLTLANLLSAHDFSILLLNTKTFVLVLVLE